MIIKKNTRVTIEYSLKTLDNRVIYSSEKHGVLTFTVGHGEVISGIEKAVCGQSLGFHCSVELSPEEAFGEYRPDYVIPYHKKHFSHMEELKQGQYISFQKENCRNQVMRVVEIQEDTIIADGNHIYAGEHIKMELTITDVEEGSRPYKGCRGCSVKGGCGNCSH